MKRSLTILIAVIVFVSCGSAAFGQAASQSLGDYARSIKKSKPASDSASKPVVYDNDNLPTAGPVSVVGKPSESSDAVKADKAKDEKTSDKAGEAKDGAADAKKGKDEPQIKPGQSADDRKQAFDAWKQKLDDQKEKVNLLSRELEVLQREYRVKASEWYADTAGRAQNPAGFAQTDAEYKGKIADKQQAVDAAKAKLSDMQDEARKAGAPNSVTE